MTLRVYALTDPTPFARALRGTDGERLRLVTVGGVAAIVGEQGRTAPRPTAAALRAYDEVVRRLTLHRPAVLPVRFGTAFHDPAELMFVLRSRQSPLRQAVSEVRRRAQMTVRVLPGSDAREPGPRVGPRSTARSGPAGARYLRARAADAARERQVPEFDRVRPAVARWIRGERVDKQAGVASVYHLVPRAAADAYRRALEKAASRHGVRVIVSGPWPPYAFGAW